jgi:hypothetical protein
MVPKRTACANTYGNSTVTCKLTKNNSVRVSLTNAFKKKDNQFENKFTVLKRIVNLV